MTRAVADAIGADRVGIRISPEHNVQGAIELDAADVRATYGPWSTPWRPLELAYLSVLHKDPTSELVQDLRARFDGPFLLNTGFGEVTTLEEAERAARGRPRRRRRRRSPVHRQPRPGPALARGADSTSRTRPRSTPAAPRATPTTRSTELAPAPGRTSPPAGHVQPERRSPSDTSRRNHEQWAECHSAHCSR